MVRRAGADSMVTIAETDNLALIAGGRETRLLLKGIGLLAEGTHDDIEFLVEGRSVEALELCRGKHHHAITLNALHRRRGVANVAFPGGKGIGTVLSEGLLPGGLFGLAERHSFEAVPLAGEIPGSRPAGQAAHEITAGQKECAESNQNSKTGSHLSHKRKFNDFSFGDKIKVGIPETFIIFVQMKTRLFHITAALLCLLVLPIACSSRRSPVADPEPPQQPDTLSVYIVGDIMCHGLMLKSAHAEYLKQDPAARPDDPSAYDWSCFLAPLHGRISGADLAIGNVEFPFGGPPYTGYPVFSGPESYLEYLTDTAGFDVLLAANNHILDKGKEGLERTLAAYREMEADGRARFTGISGSLEEHLTHDPLLVDVKGVRLAIVNFTYGTNTGAPGAWPRVNRLSRSAITESITRARERDSADLVLVLPHWGIEYDRQHDADQSSLADLMISLGADAIVGAHPHRVQDMEIRRVPIDSAGAAFRTVPVFYSLGNAVSNQNDPEGRLELAVTLLIERSPDGTVRMLDPRWEFLWCTKAGMILDGYAVIPVLEYLDRPDAWKRAPEDYDLMVRTHSKVKRTSHIDDWKEPTTLTSELSNEENPEAGSH